MIPLGWYFVLASAIFVVGLYAVLAGRTSIRILMGVELMINAAAINFAAFSGAIPEASGAMPQATGYTFAFFVIAIAAAEAAVGLAIFVNLFRLRRSPVVERANVLKG